MNCNPNSGAQGRMPVMMPPQNAQPPMCGACQGQNMQSPPMNNMIMPDRFPVGMGYVPWQNWETPYPMEQGFHRGTIFPSLDYPFMMGRCRR